MNAQETMIHIPLDKIVAEKQVREVFEETALNGMASSMKEIGQLQPIRVWRVGDKFVIVDGERRFRAAKRAGLTTLAAIVEREELDEGAVLHKQLVSECQSEKLSPLERAKAIDRLMKATGWSASEAASRLGLSPATVSKHLAILKLPEGIQARIGDGSIPASAAPELAAIDDPKKQADLAGQLAEGRLTRDRLIVARKAAQRNGTSHGTAGVSRATAMLGEGRSVTVVAENLALESWIEVIEEVLGKARRARTQGVELPTFLKMLRDQAKVA